MTAALLASQGHKAGRWLTLVGIVGLTLLGLGMTCAQWLALPRPGWTPEYYPFGTWDGGDWAGVYKGRVGYQYYWLGYFDAQGHMQQGDLWELKSVKMETFIAKDPLEISMNQGLEIVSTASLDIHNYSSSEDDWVLEQEWENLGAEKACPPYLVPPDYPWWILCGINNLGFARRAPYGVYETYLNADPTMGGCIAACRNFWSHKIP